MADNQPYIVSARKYRPATFRTVVGQDSLTQTLKNAIDTGRLAQAYLFCGPRGVGKTSCARIFAKTINCERPTPEGEACGECASCRAMEEGNSFNIIELDAASNNSVDDIRALTEQVKVPPQTGRYRVFIIDEVHMLSNQAFNAFLKTLEEPPKYVVFILATTEKHKVIPTILSRCQIYDFKRITIDDMVRHLQYVAQSEGVEAEPEGLNVIAQKADGAMRDALSIFDQVAASSMGHITYASTIANLNVLDYDYYFRLVDCFRQGDVQGALLLYGEVRGEGFDSLFFLNGLASHVRDLMVAADPRTLPLLEVSQDVGRRYVEQAQSMPLPWYYTAIEILNESDMRYRTAGDKRLLVELALIRLCQATGRVPAMEAPAEAAIPPLSTPAPARQAQTPRPEPNQAAQPAPQPAPRPTSQPAPGRPAGIARPRTSAANARGTVRISGTRPDEEPAGTKSEPPAAAPSAAVSDERMQEAWLEFAARHPEQHIMVNAMRAHMPLRADGNTFEVTVEIPGQKNAFEANSAMLMSFLREQTGCADLSLRVAVAEQTDENRPLAPIDFLRKAVTENEVLGSLLDELQAEIG